MWIGVNLFFSTGFKSFRGTLVWLNQRNLVCDQVGPVVQTMLAWCGAQATIGSFVILISQIFWQALNELASVLNNAKYDDNSQLVLITGCDNGTFCSGLDLTYLTSGDIHQAAKNMSTAIRYQLSRWISWLPNSWLLDIYVPLFIVGLKPIRDKWNLCITSGCM